MTDWDRNRAALRKHLKTDKLEDFLRWSTIQKTMFVGNVPYVWKELDDIFSNYLELAWIDEWYKLEKVLAEPCIGYGDYTYKGDDLWLECDKYLPYFTSGNLIHQLYHLKQWLDRSKVIVSQLSEGLSNLSAICEIGAGYGAMALICRRLGFTGWYHIEDLPEAKVIQGYYLHNTVGLDNITWSAPDRCDLLIACHSIGEMPIVVRERLLSQVQADAYLFASSYEFEGVDNETWFREFAAGKVSYDWAQWAHPYQENALYSVGVRV